MKAHWIDNADSWICPVCRLEVSSPAKYDGCKCPVCGFQDEKDKEKLKMNGETDILIAVQEAVRKALCEAANTEIEKLKHKFDCEMGKIKNKTIGNIINGIDIVTRHNPIDGDYTIQINIKK